MKSSNTELRDRISRLTSWSEVTFKKLSSLPNSKLTHNRWMKLVAEYYIDTLNGDGNELLQRVSTRTLLLRTVKKSGHSYCAVRDIFRETRDMPYKSMILNYDRVIQAKYPDVSRKDIEALSLRYHILTKSGGHFLSMDTHLYQDLFRSSRLPVLECYASPYNNNLKWYCSLFEEDRLFGAYPRFDEMIDSINFPCRLIANPPYTVSSIKVCISKILKYMSRHNGEFIALLPHMHDSPMMNDLLKSKNTASVLMQGGTYLLHDFLTKTDIVAPMHLYIVVNIEGSDIKSGQMASNIAHQLRMRATKMMNDDDESLR